MLYFVSTTVDKDTHQQALGFTRQVCMTAAADTPQEAQAAVSDYLRTRYSLGTVRQTVSVAKQQDEARYVFPEQIIRKVPA